jgi:ABC-type transport system substrate-binding protein
MRSIILSSALIIFFATSCFKKVDKFKGKDISFGVTAQVKGMDPIYSDDRYSSAEVARVYEGLMEYHYLKRPYELKPNLADGMPEISKDGLTYKFKIQKGVYFHDDPAFPEGKGRELVAADFVFSLKRLADPKLLSRGFWTIDGKIKGLNEWREKYRKLPAVDYDEEVEGLKALDKYTMQVVLSKPFPQFLNVLAMPFTFATAREVVTKYSREFLNHPIGTGPFKIKDGIFKQSKKIVYYKNENYRKKTYPCEATEEFSQEYLKDCGKQLPLVDRLTVQIMEEAQPRWLNFQKGKIDYIDPPKDNFASAIPTGTELSPELMKKGAILRISPSLDITYIALNMELDIFKNNKKLRHAMMLAYNVKESNRLFYSDTGIPAQSLVPPGINGYVKEFKNPYRSMGEPEKLEQAKKLMIEAGFPDGKGLPVITYNCSSDTVSRQMGEYFKKQMAEIGINIEVIQNPWPRLQEKIKNRQVMTHGIAWGADYPDAENFLQLLYGPNKPPGANGSGYDNPVYNKLFEQASIMQDSPERTAIYEKLNLMAAEEVPWLFGVHRQNTEIVHGWLRNYVQTDFEAGRSAFLNVDMEKKRQLKMGL